MREEYKNHPGKALKCVSNAAPVKLKSEWMPHHHGRNLQSARSLENIARHPRTLTNNSEGGSFNNHFKRYYSLRIVRKLSRLLHSDRSEDPSYSSQHNIPGPGFLDEPVDVHLPKRSNSDDGSRRVLSRRQILSSLREEEEESFRSMDQQNQTYTRSEQYSNHNTRETRSLERFIPQVNIIYNNDDKYDGYSSDRSSYAGGIPRSKPRTIYTRLGASRDMDLESGNSEASPAFSRFSLSSSQATCRLDPMLGDPCLRWADNLANYEEHQLHQDHLQPQHGTTRRRTKSISCSPDWGYSVSSSVSAGSSGGIMSERSESNLSSLSLCSSSGGGPGAGEGKRFSRCMLLQSISKEGMRDRFDSDSSSGCEEEPMSPGSSCSRQSSETDIDSNSYEEEVGTSDEEVDSKETATTDLNDNNTDSSKVVTNNCDKKTSSYSNQILANTGNQNLNQQNADTVLGTDNTAAGEVDELELTQLHWVGTLGIGGFGRVELVTSGINNNQTYALKKMKKVEIQEEKHQQHILNEKNIMMSCSSPFVVKLHRTFRDSRYLYMLMEPCLGGELWTILRDKKKFDDSAAKFYTACVIKAIEYLHSKGIVYRDLKPENLLLDSSGYVKLTDFGFSKQLQDGEKSWTFCGTPEYVAPEMITNKTGHDQRADIWSVGILMYELLNGIPPFAKVRNGGDGTKNNVYSEIMKGMKGVYFPPHMSSTAVELIRQLCRLNPVQRPSLAITQKFMWFASMDWVALEERRLSPPFLPKITGARDTSNFDNYSKETEQPKEDYSDWDLEF
jgi:hypothetical protein